jgi:hypothetical protein
MPWIPAPSICACRCFPGRGSEKPKPASSCIPSWTCEEAFLPITITEAKRHDVNILDSLFPSLAPFT